MPLPLEVPLGAEDFCKEYGCKGEGEGEGKGSLPFGRARLRGLHKNKEGRGGLNTLCQHSNLKQQKWGGHPYRGWASPLPAPAALSMKLSSALKGDSPNRGGLFFKTQKASVSAWFNGKKKEKAHTRVPTARPAWPVWSISGQGKNGGKEKSRLV
jgi:hypothetical protein